MPFVSGPQLATHVKQRVRMMVKLLNKRQDGFSIVLSSGSEIFVRSSSITPTGESIVLLVVGNLESESVLVADQLFELGQDFDMQLFEEAIKLQFRPELAAVFNA